MLTEDLVIIEMKRVAGLIGAKNLSYLNYEQCCKKGFSFYHIKRALDLSFAAAKRLCDYPTRRDCVDVNDIPIGKSLACSIYCRAMEGGQIIKKSQCVPNYRPECVGCTSAQIDNVRSIDQLSQEEHKQTVTNRPCLSSSSIYNLGGLVMKKTTQVTLRNHAMSDQRIKPCPLCGGEVSKVFIGNNHTKKRSIEIKCKPCNLIMKQSALRFSHKWLDERITETWNQRAL